VAAITKVSKGTSFSHLEDRFGGTEETFLPNYEESLRRLQGEATSAPTDLSQLANERVGAEAGRHFSADWLQSWWPEVQPVEPILRAGLIEAFKKGIAARLPLSALWVQAADSTFEIAISQSATQITLLVITPPVPSVGGGSQDEAGDVTLVSRRDGQIVVTPAT